MSPTREIPTSSTIITTTIATLRRCFQSFIFSLLPLRFLRKRNCKHSIAMSFKSHPTGNPATETTSTPSLSNLSQTQRSGHDASEIHLIRTHERSSTSFGAEFTSDVVETGSNVAAQIPRCGHICTEANADEVQYTDGRGMAYQRRHEGNMKIGST